MKPLCWQGKNKVGVENVPDPVIINQGKRRLHQGRAQAVD